MFAQKFRLLFVGVVIIILSDIILGRFLFAQTPPFLVNSIQAPNSEIGFRQEFNTYVWNYNLNKSFNLSPKLYFLVAENFKSSMLKLSTEEDKWKDDQNALFKIGYSPLSGLQLLAGGQSIIFVDRQSGYNNDSRIYSGYLGFQFNPGVKYYLAGKAGPKRESRFEQTDNGINYNLEFKTKNIEYEDYRHSLSLLLDDDKYKNRNNNNHLAVYHVSRTFNPGTSDSLRIFWQNQQRDNYSSIYGDVESLSENNRGIENNLIYRAASFLDINLSSRILFKDVQVSSFGPTTDEKKRKRNDQQVSNSVALVYRKNDLLSKMNISYWSQEQTYDIDVGNVSTPFSRRTAFVTPNNESKRTTLSWVNYVHLTSKDSLSTYMSASKFQYDTPDTNNFDDRDELRINSNITYFHKFRDDFLFEMQLGVNLYHMVYIFGERSADNNWNRIFRLRPSLYYQPSSSFKLKQTFEVLANYVDYDFEEPAVTIKSFVFRKFAMEDSVAIKLMPRTRLLSDFRLQLEENGQLSWEQWAEKILLTRNSLWINSYLNYQLVCILIFTPDFDIIKEQNGGIQQTFMVKILKKNRGNTIVTDPYLGLIIIFQKRAVYFLMLFVML